MKWGLNVKGLLTKTIKLDINVWDKNVFGIVGTVNNKPIRSNQMEL